MFFSSSSSSFSSEHGSELSSDRSSAIFEESEASLVPLISYPDLPRSYGREIW